MDQQPEGLHQNRCRRVRGIERVIEDLAQTDDVLLQQEEVEALGKPVERHRSR